ncbi:MAG: methylenetetrahydrofolate--tRNA-(uracil(54)-C(5))-methyltransferase (FADH(2)-oxidizing) TrmFO [Firmicutes bacterium]|nr:methylenetetrahydrofolate--tRNA-(uracil(54)-C(5))-methyltransferase (FADH(2)-oxidizing) TrmFO [Bacillota bacterium]
MEQITIIGGGLAGVEAAWQLAKRNIPCQLWEMRPRVMTPAHRGGDLAELVCSNSLRAAGLSNAVGLLKEEMRRLHSLVMEAADATAVPAGGALAVDRRRFSAYIEKKLSRLPALRIIRREYRQIPDGKAIIAAGPLASDALSRQLQELCGDRLYFHDAIAPIVSGDSIDYDIAFFASRYDKGGGADYLNCPMTREQYREFYSQLLAAELHPLSGFEREKLFSGCMPIESMARLGEDTMRFGPLKPVGLPLADGSQAYAVVQLRRENLSADMFNLVGFQTRLKWPEQRRVFRLIPGLANAEFLRYGSMHRNTYIDSPRLLDAWQRLRGRENLLFAGQISGVEGYVESAASGLAAGLTMAAMARGREPAALPLTTALGALLHYTASATGAFQPMNVNFGLLPPLEQRFRRKQEKNAALANRALQDLQTYIREQL